MKKATPFGWPKWTESDLNRRPQPFQGCALPTELSVRSQLSLIRVSHDHCQPGVILAERQNFVQGREFPYHLAPLRSHQTDAPEERITDPHFSCQPRLEVTARSERARVRPGSVRQFCGPRLFRRFLFGTSLSCERSRCRTTIEMSGLNAVEMSSLPQTRRTYVYRVQRRRPDSHEPRGTRSFARPARRAGRPTYPGGGCALVAAHSSPCPPIAAAPANRWRCRAHPWPAGPAFQLRQTGATPPPCAATLPQGLP